jgi:two-component system sensor histidine kinase ResE
MAPTVPFALLGAVQLTAVAAWLGLAATVSMSRLRRSAAVPLVVGALALTVADAWSAVEYDVTDAGPIPWLRLAGFVLLLAPAGALWRSRQRGFDHVVGRWLCGGLLAAAVAAVLAQPAASHHADAVAELGVRAAATAALLVGELLVARTALVGKLLGSIVAGVVLMAVGAVAVAGSGVAGDVQSEQSQRLLSVARGQVVALRALQTRAALNAQLVAACPTGRRHCERLLDLFASTPKFFAVLDQPGHGLRVVASRRAALTSAQLLTLAGDPIIRAALRPEAAPGAASGGPVLLPGKTETLAVVAATPGRPPGRTSAQVRPTFAAVYGIDLDDSYLSTLKAEAGYDVSLIADGRVISSSLPPNARRAVLAEAHSSGVSSAAPTNSVVDPAAGHSPTAAMVAVTPAGNGDVRLATLVVSQPAGKALAAQQTVLRRLVLTALGVLLVVAMFALWLSRRIADPVRRLTTAVGRIRRGDLTDPVAATAPGALRSRDEVGTLARAFDEMTLSLRDLTDELRSAAAAEAAVRARLETVISGMTDGLVVADRAGTITSANDEALRLLGRSADAVVGRPAADVVVVRRPDGSPMLPARRVDADGELEPAEGEAAVRAVPVRVAVAPLPGDDGSVITLVDRTREREVERLKTEFLSTVSHELRTPLTPIRGYAELLARRSDLDRPAVERFAAEILSSTERMSRVVALLVDVAALDAGRVRPAVTEVGSAGLVDGGLARWRTRWPERAPDLGRSIARGLPPVEVDVEWVGKALDELVDNAVKVTEPGSRITVRAEPAGDTVRIKVDDHGPGIDPDRLDEMLGDFSQADASATRRIGGLGLGLGFVRRVCDQFGIGLHVQTRPGRGSSFGLDLPVVRAMQTTSRKPRERRPGGRLPRRTGKATAAAPIAAGRARRPDEALGDR